MGIFVDYVLGAECSNPEMRAMLERVASRCMDLPLRSVGKVIPVEPIYNPIILRKLETAGYPLPEAIAARVREAERDRDHAPRCISFMGAGFDMPKDLAKRFFAPARAMMAQDLWNRNELPEELADELIFDIRPLTVFRAGFELEFANVMLQSGYVLYLDPGEGCESVNLAVSTYQEAEDRESGNASLWHGRSFTKTQYARNFVHAHETVCRVMDIVQEQGLLLEASDTCGYYSSRTWKDAGKRVNETLGFIKAVADVIDLGIGNLREEGASISIVENNAARAEVVDFSESLERERRRDESAGPGRAD